MKLSLYFSTETDSLIFKNYKITDAMANSMKIVCFELDNVRNKFGKIYIASGYRSPNENSQTKGASATSWHMKSKALDFKPMEADIVDVFDWCVHNINYDKIILETNEVFNKKAYLENKKGLVQGLWIHIQLDSSNNRKIPLFSVWNKETNVMEYFEYTNKDSLTFLK